MEKKTGSNSRIIPLGDRVLLRPFSEEAIRRAQGKKPMTDFVLPESMTKEKSAQGKVLAVGEGKIVDGKLVPVRIRIGDTVLFSKYGYDEVEQNGEELYLLKEDNVLAVIKNG
ncbi:MAG: co-chaperone GroES [Candidatus Zambryskibacteria bacterium]|nr:co-chaperone GroES [Candidatus Zambryskibacteria bacterium]